MPLTASSIRGSDRGYLAFHAPRYAYLLSLARTCPIRPEGRVLDIGLSPLTHLLRRQLTYPVDTLGLEERPDRFDIASPTHAGRHIQFDLNSLREPSAPRPPLAGYDLIVMAEVLEHLYTSPLLVLRFLHDALRPGGALILQTPNAAALGKRVKLLAGSNPFEMIRADAGNPGHFREYTTRELRQCAEDARFAVVRVARRFYFDARFADHTEDGRDGKPRPIVGAVKNVVYRALPPFLREGITLVLGKTMSSF